MSLPSLYVLSAQYQSLLAIDPEEATEEAIRETLDMLAGDIQEKSTNVAAYMRNLEAGADAIDDAAAKMKERAAKLRKRAASIKGYLLHNMQACEISKIESPYFTLTVKKNPASVVVFDPNQIPADFMRQKPAPPPEPDKAAIKQALQAGTDVPGCKLEQGVRLEVKA
jgi:hypothetical protein